MRTLFRPGALRLPPLGARAARRAAIATLGIALGALPLGAPLLRNLQAQDEDRDLAPATREAAELQGRADEALKGKQHATAVVLYQKLLGHLEAKKGEFPDFPESQQKTVRVHAHYNSACALALLGKKDEALAALKRSIELGFYDWQHLEKDEDLASIRGEPSWRELVSKLRGTDKQLERLEKFLKEAVSDKPLFDFDFELTTIDKQPLKLADLKGKVVLIDFFGTWCPPCREEIPSFVKLAEAAKARGEPLVILGFAWERSDPSEALEKDVRDFLTEKKVTYPVALLREKDPILERIPDLRGFPTTLWLDRSGKVRAREEGLRSFEEIEAITRTLLDEKPEGAKVEGEKKPGGEKPTKGEGEKKPGGEKPAKPDSPEKKTGESEPF